MKFRTAITTYEKLGAVEDKDRHRNWQGDELSENEPTLNQERYPYACAYREYLTDDVRLVLANLRAATRSGACAVNHLAVTEIVHKAGRAVGATANCALTGRSLTIKSRTVVNAAGPWVEGIMALDETRDADAAPRLHLSRGVHIVMDRSRLPVRNLVIMGTEDRRSIFAISRDDSVYVGTTDTSYPSGATVWPEITPEDVEYLLKPVAKTFKTDPLGPQDVIAAWSGLRPLIAKPGKQAKEISRKDEIWVGHSGLITIAGGKLTGYRKMATTVVERVLSLASDLKARPTLDEDHDEPLPGGDFSGDLANLAGTLSRETGLDEKYADRIVRLYGDESSSVVALGRDPVIDGGTVLLGEVAWAVEQEAAASLEDVIYRRTRAALYCGRECDGLLEPIARALHARLGWNDEECQSQIDSVRGQMTGDLAFKHVS
jgi:glycerol-3-phosphate dehydrogenase